MHNKKLLFIISVDSYFVSHRLHLAKIAIQNGFEVGIICKVSSHQDVIENSGVRVFDWKLSRGSINPFSEIGAIIQLHKVIKKFSPDVIHSVALKPVFYSAIVNKFNYCNIVYALGGLGFVFSSNKLKAILLRTVISKSLKFLIGRSLVILQNTDDEKILLDVGIANKAQVRLIRGAGVDVNKFVPIQRNTDKSSLPMIILPARMLWDKGVSEFVSCAKKINSDFKRANFVLVGGIDKNNPEGILEKQLMEWHNGGVITWLGHQQNMLKVYQQSDIVLFPSYREGLPMSLLESASCEIPIVAFDVPGCREVVINNENGFLVCFKNKTQLSKSINKLIDNINLRIKFGEKSRSLAIKEFSQKKIGKETLQVWNEALK
jgi:glycosyltransferase involved in cell wall biosynthesis